MIPWAVAAAGVSAAAGIGGSILQGNAVSGAQKAANEAQLRMQQQAMWALGESEGQGRADIELSNDAAREDRNNYLGWAGNQLNQANALARTDIVNGLDAANNYLRYGRDAAVGYLQPWQDQGRNALTMTGDLSGANGPDAARAAMANFQTSPGYQWRLQQGLRATDQGAASTGMLRSGAQLKAEQTFGQGLASQEFDNYYARLAGLSQQGQLASNAAAQAQLTTGAQLGQTQLNTGTALGQAQLNTGQQLGAQTYGTGNALATERNQRGVNLADLGIRAAGGQAAAATNAGNNLAQTAMSGGAAQANIYGNLTSGLSNTANNYLMAQYYADRQNPLARQQPYGEIGGSY